MSLENHFQGLAMISKFPAGQLAESDYWREQFLKTFVLFATYWCIQYIRGFTTMRYINRLVTYLLTKLFSDFLGLENVLTKILVSQFYEYQLYGVF